MSKVVCLPEIHCLAARGSACPFQGSVLAQCEGAWPVSWGILPCWAGGRPSSSRREQGQWLQQPVVRKQCLEALVGVQHSCPGLLCRWWTPWPPSCTGTVHTAWAKRWRPS